MTEDISKENTTENTADNIADDNRDNSIDADKYYYQSDKTDENSSGKTDDEFRKHIADRRRRMERRRTFKKTRTVFLLIIVFALLFTMCGKDIVRLKTENHKLKKQQAELTAERDRLKKELKQTKNKEYIQEQARKQLRLLSEGELLFLFGEDDPESQENGDSVQEDEGSENK
jgi:cell division protein DivIC